MAASFLGSSWYLAEKIRSEALAIGPGPAMPAYDDVQFVGLSSEQVQLQAVGEGVRPTHPAAHGPDGCPADPARPDNCR